MDIVKQILAALQEKNCFSFSCNGASYLIQPENNKGWDYLGLWQTEPKTLGLGKAFFDVMYGPEEAEVRELVNLRCIGGKSIAELWKQGKINIM